MLIASGAQGDFSAEAIGEIHAKVLISGSAVGSKKTDVVRRSGQMTEVELFEIFSKQIYLNRDKKDVTSIYKNYEVERQEVFIAYNNCLPIKKVILKVYELTTDEVERDKDIVIEELKDQAYKTAKANLPNGAVEGAVSFDIFEDNGFYKVVCNIETEISIGIRK